MNSKKTAYLKLAILVISVVLLSLIVIYYGKSTFLDAEWLEDLPQKLNQHKSYAFLILIGLQFLQIVICFVPGEPIQIASSYLYGIIPGFLISIVGAVLGTIAAYKIAEFLGHDALLYIFDKNKIEEYRSKLNSGRAMLIVLIIYLIPGIPKDTVAYVAGISEMKLLPFLILSTVGRSPGMIGSLLMGVFIGNLNYTGLALLFACACLITLVCIIQRRRIIAVLDKLSEKYGETDG